MELKEYLMPLRKWWWVILVATLVAAGSTYYVTRGQPPIYQARATLMVGSAISNPNPNGSEFYATQQLASTYADIAQREPVRAGALAALGLDNLPPYTVRTVLNTQLLEISVTDTDRRRAQAVANELASQLIKQAPTSPDGSSDSRQAFVTQQLDDLQNQIQATKEELRNKQEELGGIYSARQIADAQVQINGLQNKLATLQNNYGLLLSGTQKGAVNSLSIVERASLPGTPIGPNTRTTILIVTAIGFCLALAAAYLLEYLDDSLKNPAEVQKVLGLTTLSAVPAIPADDNELISAADNVPAAAEAYRVLRVNLQFAAVGRPLHILLVTSPAPGEGKSRTVANLGAVLAQAGKRVIVVDADLHRPRQHRIFKLPNSVGVTTALLDEGTALEGLLHETPVPNLRVLTSGPLPPNPAELLSTSVMQGLLARLCEAADMVVLDSPPVTALSDTAVLATESDGVLLVLDARQTRRDVARRAMAALKQVQARVVGAVLNRMPTRGGGDYYYYYHYSHYGRYYGAQNGHGEHGNGASSRKPRLGRGHREPASGREG